MGRAGCPSGHGSKFDQWFAASTQPPSGTCSRPVQRSRKAKRNAGQLSNAMAWYSELGLGLRAMGAQDTSARRRSAAEAHGYPVTSMTRLVIVESPAKARTIAGYLGRDFVVESSIGHIRDLPERASDVPKEMRERYGKLGVDVEQGFDPLYIVDADKKHVVTDLKKKLKESDELLLATDEDREGEAIAWHLKEVLNPKVPVRRMVFHEITKDAIQRALDETREIDERLVDAQETRRILDRLYGFEVSPVLWKKVMPRLSAGRVQSVATRLVVDRERERMRFVAAAYWDILGTFEPGVVRRPPHWPSTASASRRAATSARTGRRRPPLCSSSTRTPRDRSPPTSRVGRSPSRRSRRSRTHGVLPRRSGRRRSSRRRAASCGSRRRRRCASRSGSTRTATSRTCAPTP